MARASRFSKLGARGALPWPPGRHIRAADEHNRSDEHPEATAPMSTGKRLGVVMDPIGAINYAKDSTLAMLLAAQEHGFELSYLEQRDLSLRDGVALGRMRALTVRADPAGWFALGPPAVTPLSALDVLLMRKDPPFDTEYIYSTYILERAETAGVLVVNRPQGLRDINEKVYAAWFPQCCAPTLITRDMEEMAAFLAEHGRIVVKPLHGMGGRSIFVLAKDDRNARVVFENLTDYGQRFAMAQRYIPEIVESGDSRVLLIDGEALPFALARIPAPADHRGNLAAGARGVGRELNDRDRWLAGQIGPALAAKGMLFVGLDVIGGFVTEINVTSPTGIRELDKQFAIHIGELVIAALERRLKAAAAAGRAASAVAPARPQD
jgi:glutathione synthase